MLPAAPTLFSTMMVRLANGRTFSPKYRTSTSAPLPAGKPQMKRISWLGYSCARTVPCITPNAAVSTTASRTDRISQFESTCMAFSLWSGDSRSGWPNWNAVCAASWTRLILGRVATHFDARSGAMPASSRPSLTSSLRHDFREPDVVAPILDRFQEQRLRGVRRIDEGIAAEAVEKRLRLLALDYLREP